MSCQVKYLFAALVMHALLYCNGTSQSREELWEWINDIMPIEMAVHLASLTDMEFLLVILGKKSEVLCANIDIWTQLLMKFAKLISMFHFVIGVQFCQIS